MLLGALGPAAARRVGAALQSLYPDRETELLPRGELAVGWPLDDAPAVLEEAGRLCVLDGQLTSAPWLTDSGANAQARGTDVPARAATSRQTRAALQAWTQQGERLLDGARGSFTILLWQAEAEGGLLARDPTGLCPMFRSEQQGGLAFASEIVPLLAALESSPAPDRVALAFWLSNDNCWDERTLFEGVAPLRGGHLLDLPKGVSSERAWWSPRYQTPLPIGLEDAAEGVREAVQSSIGTHLPPSEETGVLLSGGIDSTSVAAMAQAQAGGPVDDLKAYSLVFPDLPRTDESQRIDEVATRLALPSLRMAVRTGSPMRGILKSIADWGVPSIAPNRFMMPPLLERIRADGVRLLLGGEGGDELFELSPMLVADRIRAGQPLRALALTRRIPGGDRQPLSRLVRMGLRQTTIATLPTSLLSRAHRPSGLWVKEPDWLDSTLAVLHREAVAPFRWRSLDGPRWWAFRAHILYTGRQLMSVSDEIRRDYGHAQLNIHQPLLDSELVELVLSLPPELAFDASFDRPVLRAAVRGILPDTVRTGVAKSDFLPVLVAGIGRDIDLIREVLGSPESRVREFTHDRVVREQLLQCAPERHPRGSGGWAMAIFRLLSIECWLRAHEDQGQLEELLERTEPAPTSFHLEPTESNG